MQTLANQVRTHRLRYGMTQAELARRVKISQTALNQIELGKVKDPKLSIILRIAHTLGVDIGELCDGLPPPAEEEITPPLEDEE